MNFPNYKYGADVFGTKPSPLSTPNILAELQKVIPGYGSISNALSSNLMSGLSGQLSPEVQQQVMDAANARAVGGGYGGSGLGRNLTNRDLGLTSKAIQDAAFGQALNYITNQRQNAVLDPNIQAEIEKYNSLINAAPNPVARGNFELDQYNKALQQSKSPIFGGSAGTGSAGASITSRQPFANTNALTPDDIARGTGMLTGTKTSNTTKSGPLADFFSQRPEPGTADTYKGPLGQPITQTGPLGFEDATTPNWDFMNTNYSTDEGFVPQSIHFNPWTPGYESPNFLNPAEPFGNGYNNPYSILSQSNIDPMAYIGAPKSSDRYDLGSFNDLFSGNSNSTDPELDWWMDY